MDNPYQPPKAELLSEAHAPAENPYRVVHYAYGGLALTMLTSVVLGGHWEPGLASIVVTAFLWLPFLTAACLIWGSRIFQVVAIRAHLVAVVGLIAYSILMVSNRQPPPVVVIVFTLWNIFSLVWSINLFKARSDSSLQLSSRISP